MTVGDFILTNFQATYGLSVGDVATFCAILVGVLFFAGGAKLGGMGLFMISMVNLLAQYYLGFSVYLPTLLFIASAVVMVLVLVGGDES